MKKTLYVIRMNLLQLILLSKTISLSTCKDWASDNHQFLNNNLKAQSHEMDTSWKFETFLSVLSVYALMVSWVFNRFSLCYYTVITFYLILWNFLLILKMLTETLLRIPFSVIGWSVFSRVRSSLAAGKLHHFSCFRAES